jgi:hypothetical protein
MADRDSENLERIRELLERQYGPEDLSSGGDAGMHPRTWATLLIASWVVALIGRQVSAGAWENDTEWFLLFVCTMWSIIGAIPALIGVLILFTEPK